ncbi:MAG TPA: TauD/TfdA family dioxygenase, partial [Thermoanaerobaculia bacterium]|nr:TauD/TfdA family dioxygenase [Thermoanaerobaculia bacterium]
KFGGERAFANTVIGAFRHAYRGTDMAFDDDTSIPEPVLEETEAVGEAHAEEINWQPGDVAMIDNTRFMHGRRSFYGDTQRQILTVLSMANF